MPRSRVKRASMSMPPLRGPPGPWIGAGELDLSRGARAAHLLPPGLMPLTDDLGPLATVGCGIDRHPYGDGAGRRVSQYSPRLGTMLMPLYIGCRGHGAVPLQDGHLDDAVVHRPLSPLSTSVTGAFTVTFATLGADCAGEVEAKTAVRVSSAETARSGDLGIVRPLCLAIETVSTSAENYSWGDWLSSKEWGVGA